MAWEATYAPGNATLMGRGANWLLLDAPLSDAAVADLWLLLARTDHVVEDVLVRLEKEFPLNLPSLVIVSANTTYESATRGDGRLTSDGNVRTLAFGAPEATRRPLLAGVVSASSARLTQVLAPARDKTSTVSPALSATPLISGIPDHILAARAAERRPLDAPTPPVVASDPVVTSEPDLAEAVDTSDHDGATMMRSHLPAEIEESPAGQEPDGHTVFRQELPETVLAVHCPEGHLTPGFHVTCRVCHNLVPEQEPRRIPRPQLGTLRLPTAELVPVDRGIVLGRRPAAIPGSEPWPHLVHLPTDSTYLSRLHLQIELDGWLVLARDLGSQGGTRLHVPGRAPELIRPHQPYVLEHGWVLDLADVYAVTFEVTG